jgi:acyl-CoA thioesterase I
MYAITLLTVGAALVVACSSSKSSTTGPSPVIPVRKIVALGDSLTSGFGLPENQAYPAQLQNMLRNNGLPFEVLNFGVSGDTTAGGVTRIQAALDERPAILILALGANDGIRGTSVAQVRSNLEVIIQAAQAKNVKILLCGMEALPVHGLQYTIEFHEIFPSLAARYNLPLVPFLLKNVLGNQAMLQSDFVHPNAEGAREIVRTIWPYLLPLAREAAAAIYV